VWMARSIRRDGGVRMVKIFKDEQTLHEILERLYFEEGCSLHTIAKILNVCYTTVWNWFKKFGIPRRSIGEAVSLAKSSIYDRPYDPIRDENTIIELNALCHTDFSWTLISAKKIRIYTSTARVGQIYFFNKIAMEHDLMPVKCCPIDRGNHVLSRYEWYIYTHLDGTFKGAIEGDKIRYLENLKDDKEALLLYFTRIVECDGWIEVRKMSYSKKVPYRKRIYAYISFSQKDVQYVRRLAEIINEVFNIPTIIRYYKKDDITKLYLPIIDKHVADLFRKMPIIHPEKNLIKDFVLSYIKREVTEDLLSRINNIKDVIHRLRDLSIQLLIERRLLDKGKRVMSADELVREVLRRYCERFNDYNIERYFRI